MVVWLLVTISTSATRLLVNRLLHKPSKVLRHMATECDPSLPEAERLIERLFGVRASGRDNAGDGGDGDEEKNQ